MQVSIDSVNLFPTGITASVDGLTIVRTRGELLLTLSSTPVAGDGWPEIAFGICIVSENAAGIGVTAIPDPIADIAWDGWYVYWTGAIHTGQNNLYGPAAAARIVIDNKAMRKHKNTDVAVGVISFLGEEQTSVVEARLNTRELVLLP